MGTNNVGLITTADMAAILVGAAIAFTKVAEAVEQNGWNGDAPSILVLFANALDQLGRAAPHTRVQEVYALAGKVLMATEIGG